MGHALSFSQNRSTYRSVASTRAMNKNTPQSLLSLSPDLQSPDAYRVLGLSKFEADRATIKAAAEQWIVRLGEERTSADEASWATAMQWVKNAYSILSDAGKKAAYDRKLAIESEKIDAADPLAGVLPQRPSSPTAGLPPTTPRFQAGHSTLTRGIELESIPVPAPPELVCPEPTPMTVPVVRRSSSKTRSRGIPWFSILASLFCIAAMGGIGTILYVLQNSDKQIVLNLGNGPLVIGVDSNGDGQAVIAPGEIPDRTRKPFDPVMGGLANDMPPPQTLESVDESPAPESRDEPAMPMMQETLQAESAPSVSSEPMVDAPMVVPTIETQPATSKVTDAQNAESEKVVDSLVEAIKRHDWEGMKTISEQLATRPMLEPLQQRAGSLYQLVDLATYYRGGIQKGLLTLQAGNEFDLTNDLKVVIVEVGNDKLIIRFNGKNKEFTFDTIPLSLAHKIAQLSLTNDDATARTAKFAFQAIAPITTPPYRDEAIAEIEKITEEVEGAEPAKLVAAIRDIYQP